MDEEIFEDEENDIDLYSDTDVDVETDGYDEENMDPSFDDDKTSVDVVEERFDRTPTVDDLTDFGYKGSDSDYSSEITENDFV